MDEIKEDHALVTTSEVSKEKPPEKVKRVNIYCSNPGGLQLRLFKMMEAKKTEEPPRSVPTGEGITLNYGFNPGIRKTFWDAWLEQHKDSSTALMLTAQDEE
jgi:hypothetical protein